MTTSSTRRSAFEERIDNFTLTETDLGVNSEALNLAIQQIPKFSGKPSELNKFIFSVETCRRGLNAATCLELQKITLNKLEGAAFQYIRRSHNVTWEELKNLLSKKFGERRSVAELQLELTKLRQNAGESVRNFAHRIESILGLMYDQEIMFDDTRGPAMESAHSDLALAVFIDGLRPELRISVRAARHSDLQEAISMAIQEERNLTRNVHDISGSSGYSRNKAAPFCKRCRVKGHHISQCRRRTMFNVDHQTGESQTNRQSDIHRSDVPPRPPTPRSSSANRMSNGNNQKN